MDGEVEGCKAKSEVARILQHATHMCVVLKRPLLVVTLVTSLFARLECVKIGPARRSHAVLLDEHWLDR